MIEKVIGDVSSDPISALDITWKRIIITGNNIISILNSKCSRLFNFFNWPICLDSNITKENPISTHIKAPIVEPVDISRYILLNNSHIIYDLLV